MKWEVVSNDDNDDSNGDDTHNGIDEYALVKFMIQSVWSCLISHQWS